MTQATDDVTVTRAARDVTTKVIVSCAIKVRHGSVIATSTITATGDVITTQATGDITMTRAARDVTTKVIVSYAIKVI